MHTRMLSLATARNIHLVIPTALALMTSVAHAHAQRVTQPRSPKTIIKTTPLKPGERRFAPDSLWRNVWAVGGDPKSDTYVEPRQIVTTGDIVVVLDDGTREVRGLDARTGAERFVLKPTGQGPGEFRRPTRLTATPAGFAIIDQADARFTLFDRRGKFVWTTVLADVFTINGLCVRATPNGGTRIVATQARHDSSIVEFDTTGKRTSIRTVPWKELVPKAVAFAYVHFASNTSAAGDCAIAPIFGAEWAFIPAVGTPTPHRVVEPGPQPVIAVSERVLERTLSKVTVKGSQQSDTPQIARGAMLIGDTIIINASQTKQYAYRLLDYYLATTGEYLYSRKLPFTVNGCTIGADGTIYITRIQVESQIIMAMKPATLAEATASARKP